MADLPPPPPKEPESGAYARAREKYEKRRPWRIARNFILVALLIVGVPIWATISADPRSSWIGTYWWVAAVWVGALALYAYMEDLLPRWVWVAVGAAFVLLKVIARAQES